MALELRPLYFSTIVAIARVDGTQVFAPDATENIQAGDHLVLFGPQEMVEHMAENLGWELQPELASFAEELSPNNAGVMEGLVTPRSELVGETLADIRLRERFKVSPLAIFRGDKLFVSGLYSFKIESGDAILLHGRWEMFHMLKEGHELVFTEDVKGEILRTEKAKIALMWLAVSLVMILGFHVQLSIALLAGALGMILTKVLTIDEAYQSVDWMTVFLLGGLIPLGMAFENTGAAKYIADTIMAALGGSDACGPVDRHRYPDLVLHPGRIQCRRNGATGAAVHEHGYQCRGRSAYCGLDGCFGGFEHVRVADPSGQRIDHASRRVQDHRLRQGRCRHDRPVYGGHDNSLDALLLESFAEALGQAHCSSAFCMSDSRLWADHETRWGVQA